jgi:hypothetical protein
VGMGYKTRSKDLDIMDSDTPSPLTLIKGTVFTGTATQHGTIKDGQLHFEARQRCAIWFTAVKDECVECVVGRTEDFKSIDGISDPGDRRLPSPYVRYLTEKGSSAEDAFGTYNPFTRVLLLKGSTPTVIKQSDVHWNTHFYSLVLSGDGKQITGTAFCTDNMDDRENGVGSLVVKKE